MKFGNNVLIFKAISAEASDAVHNSKDPYQEVLENLNLNVRLVSVLDFKFTNLDTLRRKLESPEDYSALVFGSPRCVYACTKAVEKLDSKWKNRPIFAVGETTGQILSDRFGVTAEGTSSGYGAALAPIILQHNLQRPVLIPCGNLNRDVISTILKDNGVSSDNVQVYETIPHPDLESNLKKVTEDFSFSVIIYFSPSGMNATIPLLKKFSIPLEEIKIVSIGPTTEKALEDLGFKVSATAAKPTPESLASAVASILT
ncbi:uroporphyrinogen-III synthase-like [Lycorma delicatula]|uniref:uroporphyrinogen-III synthase-like n=1 Tax=Lycorma delicatula TaxID=130591 RepID=UPI003F516991